MTTGKRINLIDNAPQGLEALYENANAAMTDDTLPGPTLFGNQVRTLAHNPALLQALTDVYATFAETQSVDRKLVELGILIVSHVNACTYCVQHHAPLAHKAGLTAKQLQAIQAGDWAEQRAFWSEEEWLIINYAEQMTREPYKITDTFFEKLREYFNDRQIVDLTMRFALCSAWNKFNDALQLDTESTVQHVFAELKLS